MNTLQIDNYFQGKFSAEEKKAFDERLANEPSFADEVAFYLHTKATIREDILQARHQEWTQQKQTSIPLLKIGIGIAAMLILGIGYLFFFQQKQTSAQLATAYIDKTFAKLPTNMDSQIDSLSKGVALYNEEKYEASLQIFKQLNNIKAPKYAGQAALKLKRYDEAIDYFQRYAAQNESTKSTGNFLTALVYLEKGEKEKATALLKIIASNDLDSQSRELLKQLSE